MNVFFDNTLPPKLAHACRVLHEGIREVKHLRDRVPSNTPDAEWMESLIADGLDWVVLSHDHFSSAIEKRIIGLQKHRVDKRVSFVRIKGQPKFEELSCKVICHLPKVLKCVEGRPGVYQLTLRGKISRL